MDNRLTEQELEAKDIMENKFIPLLHEIFEKANPEEYLRWGKNCCRQSAIFGALVLKKLLPAYNWQVWDGIFEDIVKGRKVQYNHAWIYGFDKGRNRKLFVDLSRLHHERIFQLVEDNQYPKDIPSYEHMTELQRVRLDIKQHLEVKEYYTKKSSKILSKEIIDKCLN